MLRIGVELPDALPGTGEFVADLQALETAGVDTLWVGGRLDPWPRLGAIAAVTYRSRLGILDLDPSGWRPDALRALLATVARLARHGFAIGAGDDAASARLRDAVPAGTALVRIAASGTPAEGEERWARVAAPADRAAWRETRAAQEASGATGVIVAMNPRLLDLLRNPDIDDDRSDLQIAVG